MKEETTVRISRSDYARFHKIINLENGRANHCTNKNCNYSNPKKFDWALRKGCNYSANVKDYIQLCRSCHIKYDFTDTRRQKLRIGLINRVAGNPGRNTIRRGSDHPSSKKIVKKDMKSGKTLKKYLCIGDVEKDGYRPATVSMCLTGRNKTAFGFKWEYIKQPLC